MDGRPISRRDFLRLSALTGGMTLLAACGGQSASPAAPKAEAPKPAEAQKPADAAKPAAPAAAPAATTAPASKPAEAAKPAAAGGASGKPVSPLAASGGLNATTITGALHGSAELRENEGKLG